VIDLDRDHDADFFHRAGSRGHIAQFWVPSTVSDFLPTTVSMNSRPGAWNKGSRGWILRERHPRAKDLHRSFRAARHSPFRLLMG